MTGEYAARRRTRGPLFALLERLRSRYPLLVVDSVWLHALRDYGAECYELGRVDLLTKTTLPPKTEDVAGTYSISNPDEGAD